MTDQCPSDPYYCRSVESATALIVCDWTVLQTTVRSRGRAAVMQGGKRMVCLPRNGLALFHRLPSTQSANFRSELLPTPSKNARSRAMDDTSNGSTAATTGYGVFTPARYQVLSLFFSGSQPAFKAGAECLFSAHNFNGKRERTDTAP